MHNCSHFPYLNHTFQYFSRLNAVFAWKIFNYLYNTSALYWKLYWTGDVHYLTASWATEKANSFDMSSFKATHIEKLSGDNTHDEKERVMSGLRTG